MKTISKEIVYTFEERKSKFITYLKAVSTKSEALDFIETIKSMNKTATHNVFAFKIIENGTEHFKYSDDGEPNDTAGKPIAELLNILGIFNVVVVVSRYFGGIKLGAGGLIRAYSKAAKLAIEEAGITEYQEKYSAVIDFPYSKTDIIDKELMAGDSEVLEKRFESTVVYRVRSSLAVIEKIRGLPNVVVIML